MIFISVKQVLMENASTTFHLSTCVTSSVITFLLIKFDHSHSRVENLCEKIMVNVCDVPATLLKKGLYDA